MSHPFPQTMALSPSSWAVRSCGVSVVTATLERSLEWEWSCQGQAEALVQREQSQGLLPREEILELAELNEGLNEIRERAYCFCMQLIEPRDREWFLLFKKQNPITCIPAISVLHKTRHTPPVPTWAALRSSWLLKAKHSAIGATSFSFFFPTPQLHFLKDLKKRSADANDACPPGPSSFLSDSSSLTREKRSIFKIC